ncbi:MAG: sulfatase family protein [Thermoguttaceae bacterium]
MTNLRMLVLAVVGLGCGLCGAAGKTAVADRPNILIILADDLGYGSVGSYGADPKLVRTPNIDRLARQGRRFTDANTTSSVCSPTRYSLLSGRYCWRTSLKHEVLNPFAPLHIEPGRLNLASLLKRHGYATAAIGKWHLGYGQGRTDYTGELKPGPLEIGFDYHFGVPSNHGDVTGVYVENHRVFGLRSDTLVGAGKNFRGKGLLGLDAPQRVNEDVMPTLTDKAVAWLETQSPQKPFFLYFTPVAVHNPVTPSARTKGTSAAGPYGDWIHELDLSVGRLLEVLDRRQMADSTLVIFTSDNGGSGQMSEIHSARKPTEQIVAMKAGLDFNKPWRGRKHSVYEGGFRVPFLVRWPGKVPAGTTCNDMISVADLLATIAAIVGEKLPPPDQGAEDSFNILPALLGQPHAEPLRPDMIVHSADGNFAIRQGPWKFIEGGYHPDTKPGALKARAEEFRPQLYNLQEDPGERRDLSADRPEVVERLRALLERHRKAGHSRP